MAKIALYLAGGGARGAYQAGVLKAIDEILQTKKLPFSMLSGVSIGAFNAAVLAQHADDFSKGVNQLTELWSTISCSQIFNTSNFELGKSVFRNIGHFIIKQHHAGFLLDTTPLHHFVSSHINFEKIRGNISANGLETFEVIANCYEIEKTVSFYQHCDKTFEDWVYPRHISQATTINQEHIIASGSLPLFFPAIPLEGCHYGDGSVGLVSPLRGAIRFNVDKILVIGTRQSPSLFSPEKQDAEGIGFAQVLGNMMSGLFLDNLDRDIEMVNRMNEISQLLSIWNKHKSPWRPVETLYCRPNISMASSAQNHYKAMPAILRMLLNVLGAKYHSGDLLSFLLFEKEFTLQLLDSGYKDTMDQYRAILEFFEGE
jgi:NTE family protein